MIGKLECPCCDNGEMRPLTEDEKIDLLIDMLVGEGDETKDYEGVEREQGVAPIVSECGKSHPQTHTTNESAKVESESVEVVAEDGSNSNDDGGLTSNDATTVATKAVSEPKPDGGSREDAVDKPKPLPFASAKTCPECGGLLEPLTEAEREAVIKEFETDEVDCPSESGKAAIEPPAAVSGDSVEEDKNKGKDCLDVDNDESVGADTGKLNFIERNGIFLADTRGLYDWDGTKETMPSDWIGNGYFVVTDETRVRSCGLSRQIITGCLVYGRSYHSVSYRDTGKTKLWPVIYRDRESAREVLKLHIQHHNRNGYYWQKLVDQDTVKREVGSLDIDEVLHRVIPIEDYEPRMKKAVLDELRYEALAIKREVDSGEAEEIPLEDFDRVPSSEEMARRQDAFLKEVSERKRRDPLRHRMSSGYEVGGREDDDAGTPLASTKMIADWSKVDWNEEALESDRLERQQLGLNRGWGRNEWETCTQNVRRTRAGLKTIKTNEKWLLSDWATGKFVKIENGDAILVPREDCTFFEKLSDANDVAIKIERKFWNPAYVRWRLHVVPYTESENDKENGTDKG